MIIYGWRGKVSQPKALSMGTCAKCSQGPLKSFTVFRYFHIYWIPLFPYSRKLWFWCDHSQGSYEVDPKASNATTEAPGMGLQKEKPPLYLFSGLALLALLIVGLIWSNQKDNERYHALLAQPQAGDLLVMKLEPSSDPKHPYGVARVVSVDEKQVHLVPSTYMFGSRSSAVSEKSLKLLRASDAFADQDLVYERQRLLQMLEEGKIEAAIRDAAPVLPQAPAETPGVKVSIK